jgi:hypothetical protein
MTLRRLSLSKKIQIIRKRVVQSAGGDHESTAAECDHYFDPRSKSKIARAQEQYIATPRDGKSQDLGGGSLALLRNKDEIRSK